MFELNNFDAIKISLVSPKDIREWSNGEVTKAETLNYRTQKPEKDGLFCEKIFGPSKNYECHCGKYKRPRYKGVTCDKCGVLVTTSNIRRERMGHIELACPVSHIWFFKINPSKIGLTLDIKTSDLEQVLYYVSYIVTDPGITDFEKKQVITDREYREAKEKYGHDSFKAGMGAEIIKQLLKEINLKKEIDNLSDEMKNSRETKKLLLGKRKKILENFYISKNKPEWMVVDVIPVLPPDLRPMVQLDGGRFATNDLNDLYRRVLNRNIRLKKIIKLGAPEVIIRNEKRMLQEAVDALYDNGRRGKAVTGGAQNRQLKSLTESLKGKQGRFRQNLLGKRVDYSGRAVIVIGPELKMYQCGIPKQMALELFKPFIIQRLLKMNDSYNIKSARKIVDCEKPVVWDILEEIIKDHPVLLNRAPTLHKLGIQAFEPIIVEGNSIRLHPLVCAGFNADFDGDQMSVHVPLSIEARTEARLLMLASNNIVKPSDGEPIATPQQDIVLGIYYLTIAKPGAKGEGKIFASEDEAISAYILNKIAIQSEIYVRKECVYDNTRIIERVKTTVGRIIFNEVIPQDIGIVDRENRDNCMLYEIDYPVGKKELSKIIALIYEKYKSTKTAKILDMIKELGFKYSTIGGITMNVYDMKTPKERQGIINEAQELVDINNKNYRRGLITLTEKIDKNIELWDDATSKVSKAVQANLDTFNPIKMIADSKARTNPSQLNQVCGMRGITAVTSAQKIDLPIKNNYKSGLTPLDYFISARGGRKGLADKALGTSMAGYLTRRLVEISQEVIVTTDDCFADNNQEIKGLKVKSIIIDSTPVVSLENRIIGRYAVEDIKKPGTGDIIIQKNSMITKEQANEVVKQGIEEVTIRTNLTCSADRGVCAKCYGKDMSNSNKVDLGEAVGIIAAQAIGEPGTQLTMNNFHTGGISSGATDITEGLPRVEELFEARTPKGTAIISLVAGEVIEINNIGKLKQIIIKTDKKETEYTPDFGKSIIVKVGDKVNPGDALTSGPIDPKELLHTQGIQSVQKYIMNEILSVYSKQSVEVNPKHLEIIIKQMLTKVQIIGSGETDLLIGSFVDVKNYDTENIKAMKNGKTPATAKRVIHGLQKASIKKESFLSAASFQETSRVLTEAAIEGKTDNLLGLKENLLIGRLIPAGTGVKEFRKLLPKSVSKEFDPYSEIDEDKLFNKISD